MARRNWIQIVEYSALEPPILEDNCLIIGILTALVVPLGLQVQCIRHVRFPHGDVFLLPSYRSNALEDYDLPKQNFFRIRGKHKALKFQLALEEALLRDTTPGPLNLPPSCMPRIPAATRKAALQPDVHTTRMKEAMQYLDHIKYLD